MKHTQRPLTARQAFARGYRARDTYLYSGTPQAPAERVVAAGLESEWAAGYRQRSLEIDTRGAR